LKESFPEKSERLSVKEDLLKKLENESYVKYNLPNNTSLILSKEIRKVSKLKRYEDSPFPLLSNIECFNHAPGDWNSELIKYGIKTRHKLDDHQSAGESGVQVFLIKYSTLNNQSNKYLLKQYKRLRKFRDKREITKYWKLSWQLMTQSWSFRLACLNSWQPLWYRNQSIKELNKTWTGLNRILNLEELVSEVRNVWIESPKDKWRQLGIPSKSWRLYFHMLNMWITYIYDPYLSPKLYDGFIFNRGCKSWWEYVLWSPLLQIYSSIIELDFSSGFPNLSLHGVKRALHNDKLIPKNLINLILSHLKSSPHSASSYPTLETYIENEENQAWRKSCRSVHMGIGISPILFVITLNWALIKENLLSLNMTYKWYADDGSIFFNLKGLWEFFWTRSFSDKLLILKSLNQKENPILKVLNNSSTFQKVGLRICSKKSGLVRLFQIWIKPYKSLGLTLSTPLSIWKQVLYTLLWKPLPYSLQASTRGRGANPTKKQQATSPSNLKLDFKGKNKRRMDLERMLLEYKPYFGLLLAKLYNNNKSPSSQNKLLDSKPGSLLWKVNPHKQNKNLSKSERFTLYNAGSKMNWLFLSLISPGNPDSEPLLWINSQLEREATPPWKEISRFAPNMNHKDYYICDCWNKADQSVEYFKKYSEIKLTEEQKKQIYSKL